MAKPLKAIGIGLAIFFTGGLASGMLATFLTAAGAGLVVSGVLQAFTKPPDGARTESFLGNYTGTVEYQQVVFGSRRVGGNVATLGTDGTRNEDFHIVLAVSLAQECGIEGIGSIWLGNREVTEAQIDGSGDVIAGEFAGFVNIRKYLGTSTQTADADVVAALKAKGLWDDDAHGRGTAYVACKFIRPPNDADFQKLFPNGPPTVNAQVFGQKVYDPRKDSTQPGGSGTHRVDDSSTWEWSDNSALCCAQYAIMKESDGGAGLDTSRVVWDVVAASANRCDSTISTPIGDIPRFKCDVVLSTADERDSNLDLMLTSMWGHRVITFEGLKLYAGQYDAPESTTITADWLRADGTVDYTTKLSGRDLWNAVKAKHVDADSGKPVPVASFLNANFESEDKDKRIWTEREYMATTNPYRAQYLSFIEGMRSRAQRRISLPLDVRGFDLEPWKTYELDIPELGIPDGTVFRLIVWDLSVSENSGGVDVELWEERSVTYEPVLEDFVEVDLFTVPDPLLEKPPNIENITAEGVMGGMLVEYDALDSAEYAGVEFEISTAGATGPWTVEVTGVRGDSVTIGRSTSDEVWVRARAFGGVTGKVYSDAYSSVVSATPIIASQGAEVNDAWGDITDQPTWSTDDRVPTGFNASGNFIGAYLINGGTVATGTVTDGSQRGIAGFNASGDVARDVPEQYAAVNITALGEVSGSFYLRANERLFEAAGANPARTDQEVTQLSGGSTIKDSSDRVQTTDAGLTAAGLAQAYVPQTVSIAHVRFHNTDNILLNGSSLLPDGGTDFNTTRDPNVYTDGTGGSWDRTASAPRSGTHVPFYELPASTNITSNAVIQFNRRLNGDIGGVECNVGDAAAFRVWMRRGGTAASAGTFRVRLRWTAADGSLVSVTDTTVNNTTLTTTYQSFTVVGVAPSGVAGVRFQVLIEDNTTNTSGSTVTWRVDDARAVIQRKSDDIEDDAVTQTKASPGMGATQNTGIQSGNVLTSTDLGSNLHTIDLAAGNREAGGVSVSWSSDAETVTGGQRWWVAVVYGNGKASAPTDYIYTTNEQTITSDPNNVPVGVIDVPSSGSGTGSTGGGTIEP